MNGWIVVGLHISLQAFLELAHVDRAVAAAVKELECTPHFRGPTSQTTADLILPNADRVPVNVLRLFPLYY